MHVYFYSVFQTLLSFPDFGKPQSVSFPPGAEPGGHSPGLVWCLDVPVPWLEPWALGNVLAAATAGLAHPQSYLHMPLTAGVGARAGA